MLLVESQDDCSKKVNNVEAAQDSKSDAEDVLQAESKKEGS